MAKILIGYPCKDDTPADFNDSLANMVIHATKAGHDIKVIHEHGGLYDARDRICAKAVAGRYDYMMQLDTDQVFPADGLEKLLSMNKDICTGVYVGKEPEHRPVLFTDLRRRTPDEPPRSYKRGLVDLMKNDNGGLKGGIFTEQEAKNVFKSIHK